MKIYPLLLLLTLSGCSWISVEVGVGYDLNDRDSRSERPTHGRNPVGYIKATVPVWSGFQLDYIHLSSIPDGDTFRKQANVTDMIGISYKFGVGND